MGFEFLREECYKSTRLIPNPLFSQASFLGYEKKNQSDSVIMSQISMKFTCTRFSVVASKKLTTTA